MLSALLLLAPVLASATINSIGYGPHGLELNAGENEHAASAYEEVALKEICYRNLYADVAAFTVKYQKEVLVADKADGKVYLADGTRKDENNVEFYYEEFCYKQYKLKDHEADYSKVSGISIGKRSLIDTLGFKGLGGLSLDSDSHGPADDAGLFTKGSFLDSFANTYGDGSMNGDAFGSLGEGEGVKQSVPVSQGNAKFDSYTAPHGDNAHSGATGGAEQIKGADDSAESDKAAPKARRMFSWHHLIVRGRSTS
ncbi:hypothetical protein Rt10032_c07g3152 [Rhodotorula toruloides]|uniref:Proteophosphoglycan ppg4 n=1 Tax=Rhodotorula toruloides TaxID=5286 RepID=A0A511KGU5_RHOTO|nr:hypothetical protein Rt10032_c07g3152 [Rhodotorula toruloides]